MTFPDNSPLAVALCLPGAWLETDAAEPLLSAIGEGGWTKEIRSADAAWDGGVIHQALLATAFGKGGKGSGSAVAIPDRRRLIGALLRGGARPPSPAPGTFPAYNLDVRLAGWLALAASGVDGKEVFQHMEEVEGILAKVAGLGPGALEKWIGSSGVDLGCSIGGMPLWAHLALPLVFEGLDSETRAFTTAVGGQGAGEQRRKNKEAKKQRLEVLMAFGKALPEEVALFKGIHRKSLRRNEERLRPLTQRVQAWWPASALYVEVVAALKERWFGETLGTFAQPDWSVVLKAWERRWPVEQSLWALLETNQAEPLYRCPPKDILNDPPVSPAWLQTWLAAYVVCWHAKSAARTEGLDALKFLSARFPDLLPWRKALKLQMEAGMIRPTRLNVDAWKAMELDCQLSEPSSAASARPRF